jgi:hypothetical protein
MTYLTLILIYEEKGFTKLINFSKTILVDNVFL